MVGFQKVLSYRVILLITINSIIGSGLFFLPAIGAKYAGPASLISWLILSGIAIYTAMCFGEMASMFPKAGGIYEFSKQAYGPFTSFIMGWIAWIVGNVTIAMLIVGAIQYILPSHLPIFIIFKLLISLFWVLIFNYMTYRGLKTSSFMLITFSVITISLIVLLIVVAAPNIEPSHFTKLFSDSFFIFDSFKANFLAIFLTLFFISEAFFGLESVLFLSEEAKNPEKVIPKALVHGTIIIALLTLALITVSFLLMDPKVFASSKAPFADFAFLIGGSFFKKLVTLGTYLVIIGAAAGWIVTGPRLIVSLARDRMFHPKFADLHPVFGSPHRAIIFQAFVTSFMVFVGFLGEGYKTLLSMLIPLVLFMMGGSILALSVLRYRKPHLHRPYKAPFPFFGPIFLIIFHLFLFFVWFLTQDVAKSIFAISVSTILVGIPMFFFLQAQYNPRYLVKFNGYLSFLYYLLEDFFFPKKERAIAIKSLGNLEGKSIYEYGCSEGALTLELAKAVGPYGKVYASDASKKSLKFTSIRLLKKGFTNVKNVYDIEPGDQIPEEIPDVDGIISFGVLGNIQRIDHILSDLNRRLKVGDKIVFLEYDKFLHIISNINWLASPHLIKHVFRRNGFLVSVKKERGFFWQNVWVRGKKVMDSQHIAEVEKLNVEEVWQDCDSVKEPLAVIKDVILSFKERIDEKNGVLVLSSTDIVSFYVNELYFRRIFILIGETFLSFFPDEGRCVFNIETSKDGLKIRVNSDITREGLEVISHNRLEVKMDYEATISHKEHAERFSFLKRLVALGFKGNIEISDCNGFSFPKKETLVIGSLSNKKDKNPCIEANILIPWLHLTNS